MIYKTPLIFLIFCLCSCKPQNKKQTEVEKINHYEMESKHEYNKLVTNNFETFDVKRFDKNKDEAEDYIYSLNEGTSVREFGDEESGYFSEVTPKKSLFTIAKVFYTNSNIESKGPKFKDDCEIGVWYDFDEKGEFIKETDLDKPFKITIEDIIEFLKKNEADLFSTFTSVNRAYDEETKKGTWDLIYRGKYRDKLGMYNIKIDDSTSEITRVIKILGKEGEKEILFEK
jgi:hypothetical protein